MLVSLIPNTVFDGEVLQICVLTRILGNLQLLVKSVVLFLHVTLTSCFLGMGRGGIYQGDVKWCLCF